MSCVNVVFEHPTLPLSTAPLAAWQLPERRTCQDDKPRAGDLKKAIGTKGELLDPICQILQLTLSLVTFGCRLIHNLMSLCLMPLRCCWQNSFALAVLWAHKILGAQ